MFASLIFIFIYWLKSRPIRTGFGRCVSYLSHLLSQLKDSVKGERCYLCQRGCVLPGVLHVCLSVKKLPIGPSWVFYQSCNFGQGSPSNLKVIRIHTGLDLPWRRSACAECTFPVLLLKRHYHWPQLTWYACAFCRCRPIFLFYLLIMYAYGRRRGWDVEDRIGPGS